MQVFKEFYRSKLSRRIILLFIFCSLIPLGLLSFLSYRQVINHLNDQSFQLLQQTTKTIAMSVYERLLFLQSEMNLLGPTEKEGIFPQLSKDVATGTALTISDRFIGIMRVDQAGDWHPLLGQIDPRPALPEIDTTKKRFEKYQPHIFSEDTITNRTRIFMAVPAGPAGWQTGMFIGEISPGYLC